MAAFMVVKDQATVEAGELGRLCRQHLASYKVPRVWQFFNELPQTASGKVRKFALRETVTPKMAALDGRRIVMTNLDDTERRARAERIVDELLESLRRHDMKAFADAWAPQGSMEFPFAPPGYPRLNSRDEVWEYVRDYTRKIDLYAVTERARHYTLDPYTVVLEFSAMGRLAQSGGDYAMDYVAVISVGPEGIESYRDYWNSLAVANALGGPEAFVAAFGGGGGTDG